MNVFLAVVLSLCLTLPAFAEVCSPQDAATRILASPNPNDIRPDWAGEAYIGEAWSLDVARRFTDEDTGLSFLGGELLSPRGSEQGYAYGLEPEWVCD